MLSLWSEHSCLTRQEIKDYIESIQRQDVTTEGGQSATTVVTAMEEFNPILDVGEPGIVEQSIGERDSTTEMMRNVTTEGGQSATTVVTAMEEFGPILDVDMPGIIERNVGERDSAIETMQSVTSEEGQSTTNATPEKTTTDVSFLYGAATTSPTITMFRAAYGGEEETTATIDPTIITTTATHAAATTSPTITMSRAAYGGEEEAAATIEEAAATTEEAAATSRNQHSVLILFSMIVVMAGIGLMLCILSCGVGLARGALHIRVSERDEV